MRPWIVINRDPMQLAVGEAYARNREAAMKYASVQRAPGKHLERRRAKAWHGRVAAIVDIQMGFQVLPFDEHPGCA